MAAMTGEGTMEEGTATEADKRLMAQVAQADNVNAAAV